MKGLFDMKKLDHTRLAEGEVTGHFHAATSSSATLFAGDDGNPSLLDAPYGSDVTHQEHSVVTLPPGQYDISRVLEYDPFEEEVRNVAD